MKEHTSQKMVLNEHEDEVDDIVFVPAAPSSSNNNVSEGIYVSFLCVDNNLFFVFISSC